MRITDLLKIQSALAAAEHELRLRGDELRRLQDVEMVPLGISVTAKVERDVQEAQAVVQRLIDALEKQLTGEEQAVADAAAAAAKGAKP